MTLERISFSARKRKFASFKFYNFFKNSLAIGERLGTLGAAGMGSNPCDASVGCRFQSDNLSQCNGNGKRIFERETVLKLPVLLAWVQISTVARDQLPLSNAGSHCWVYYCKCLSRVEFPSNVTKTRGGGQQTSITC